MLLIAQASALTSTTICWCIRALFEGNPDRIPIKPTCSLYDRHVKLPIAGECGN